MTAGYLVRRRSFLQFHRHPLENQPIEEIEKASLQYI